MRSIMLIYGLTCVTACIGCSSRKAAAPPVAKKEERALMDARERLLERVGDINNPSLPRPLVTLEEFFEDNDDYGSIGYNLPDPPQPREFYELLKEIRQKPEVSDVRIEVKDLEDPDGWPATDTIWIITSAAPAEVRSWFPERLAPDDVYDGFSSDVRPVEPYAIPPGMRAIGAWYD